MNEQKFCENCGQKHDCQWIYKKLGGFTGPSIALRVVLAFLTPMLIFIISLAASQEILARFITKKSLLTTSSFLLALSVAFVCVLIAKWIDLRLNKKD